MAASSDRPPEGLARVVRPHKWRRRTLKLVLGVAAVLLVLRIAAPFVIEAAINHRLARIPEYRGKVADVDLYLLRGAYALDDVDVRKRGNEGDAPFFAARRIDFSVAWRELFDGRIVSDIAVEQARLVFVRAHTEQESTLETDERWQDVIQDVFPIEIEHLEIRGGDLHYVDETQTPEVDVSIRELHVVATGLRNRKRSWDEDILPAAVSVEGTTVGDGKLKMLLRLAPLEEQPVFDLDLQVERMALPAWNDFLRAYANVDVSRGTFEMFLEVAARDGAFRGYVKPFFRNLDFENRSDRGRPLLAKIWESVVNFMENVLKNRERDQLGTRVPFSGDFAGTEVGTITAVINAIRYGFGAAFSEAVEGELEPSDVRSGSGDEPPRKENGTGS